MPRTHTYQAPPGDEPASAFEEAAPFGKEVLAHRASIFAKRLSESTGAPRQLEVAAASPHMALERWDNEGGHNDPRNAAYPGVLLV